MDTNSARPRCFYDLLPDWDWAHQEPEPTGYLHEGYAASLAEWGTPTLLPRSLGWILRRPVPDTELFDGMGLYPVLACRRWDRLGEDLCDLAGLVSLTAVPDPFGDYDLPTLRRCFPDLCVPFKEHFVINLHDTPFARVSAHHHKQVRKALRRVTVEDHPDPLAFLDEFVRLHSNLVARHNISGIRAFSPKAFRWQLSIPGAKLHVATHEGRACGAILWLIHNDVAWGHVLGVDDVGYKVGAQYALYWFAIERLAKEAEWINVGGVPGSTNANEGLGAFKRGWTQVTRTSYLCGRVFDRAAYDQLVRETGTESSHYSPAYRAGELV